jgi:hypothetical protein
LSAFLLSILKDPQENALLASEFPDSGFRVVPLGLLADARIIIIIIVIIIDKTVLFVP